MKTDTLIVFTSACSILHSACYIDSANKYFSSVEQAVRIPGNKESLDIYAKYFSRGRRTFFNQQNHV